MEVDLRDGRDDLVSRCAPCERRGQEGHEGEEGPEEVHGGEGDGVSGARRSCCRDKGGR
jgi:hypothetical protein